MRQFEVKRKQIEYLSKALEIILFLIIERSLGLEGSGFFLIALVLFCTLWIFFGENLPDALGKIIRTRKSKGQYKSIHDIRMIAFFCQLIYGAIGSLIMIGGGTVLGEKVFLCSYSSLMIWVLSPLIFLRGMTFLFLGYCQGEGFELPAVITCIARQVTIYGIGSVFGVMIGNYGDKVSALLKQEQFTAMYTAVGWCLGYVLAEVIMLVFVFFSYLGKRKKTQNNESDSLKANVSIQGYVGAIFRNMNSKMLIRFLEMFPVLLGMMIFYHREGEKAPLSFGTYFVGYFAICLLGYYLLCAVIVPYWGKVRSFFKQSDKRLGRITFQGGIHVVFMLGGALSAIMVAMPAQIGGLAGFTSPNLVKIVMPGGFWILFMSLAFYFSRMLMRFKMDKLCLIVAGVSDVLFLMVFLIFWKDEKMGILALMYASLIATGLYAFLLGVILIPMIGGKVNWLQIVGFPLLGLVFMGGIQYVCVKLLGMYLKDLYLVLGIGGLGIFFYVCALLMIKNFSEEELSLIPSGGFLFGLGKMLGVF